MLLAEKFIDSCDHADSYPTNLLRQETFIDYSLTDYQERLKERASELFSPEGQGCLRIWQYDDEEQSKFSNLVVYEANADWTKNFKRKSLLAFRT